VLRFIGATLAKLIYGGGIFRHRSSLNVPYRRLSTEATAVIALRKAPGSGSPVAIFDIVAFGALGFVVIDLAVVRALRVPRRYFRHCHTFCAEVRLTCAVENLKNGCDTGNARWGTAANAASTSRT
jgi:hypothetical protein